MQDKFTILQSRQAYNLIADRYENWRWYPFWRANEGPLVKSWLLGKHGVGLDAGCGNAPYLTDYTAITEHRILVDISEGMLAKAKKQLKGEQKRRTSIIQSNLSSLPIRKNVVDFIVCTRVLSNINDSLSVFNELSRVLKNKGELLLTDIHPEHTYDYTAIDTPTGRIFIETYKHSISQIITMAKISGFRLIEYNSFNLLSLYKQPDPKSFSKLYAAPETPIFFSMKFEKSSQ